MAKKKNKILLIGVDGAEPTIIFDLARRRILENFERLMNAGAYGRLRSTIPAHTVPAWTSSVTGVNPGKHGLYDFFLSFNLETKKTDLADSTKRKTRAFWNLLSDVGKQVIILNVPVTFPPEKVNGVMVSGMLTPSLKSQFTYPSSLKDELVNLGYQIDIGGTLLDLLLKRVGKKRKMLSLITKLIKNRTRTAKYLMSEFEWDLFMVVFVGLDRLQHWYWNFIDPNHVIYDVKEAHYIHKDIMNVYKEVDKAIGELMKISGRHINIIIYSDHGFRAVNRFFFTNEFLRRKKMLSIKKQKKVRPFIGRENIFNIIKTLHLDSMVDVIPTRFKRKIGNMMSPSTFFLDVDQVDINCTKAFQFSNFIRINHEIMDSQKQEKTVKEIENLFSKSNFGINVYPRDSVFSGPETKNIPRLVLFPKRDVNPSQLLPLNGVLEIDNNSFIRIPSLMRQGDHSLWGILLMTGPQIKTKAKSLNADIIDIAPSVLYVVRETIPKSMDGYPCVGSDPEL